VEASVVTVVVMGPLRLLPWTTKLVPDDEATLPKAPAKRRALGFLLWLFPGRAVVLGLLPPLPLPPLPAPPPKPPNPAPWAVHDPLASGWVRATVRAVNG